jgi:hypothetical protein
MQKRQNLEFFKYISLLIIAILAIASNDVFANGASYHNRYYEALRVHSAFYQISCEKAERRFSFYAESYKTTVKVYNADYNRAQYDRLVKNGVPEDMIFLISLSQDFVKFAGQSYTHFRQKLAVLHIDTPLHFYFSFPDSNRIIHLQLTEPNMKPISLERLPKNAIVNFDEKNNISNVVIPKVAYIWENDMLNKKLSCSIPFSVYSDEDSDGME